MGNGSEVVAVGIDRIRIDGGTQIRERIDEDVVADYAEKMTAGVTFAPPIVFHDGSDYWLGDGFHRYFAKRKDGATHILCEVRKGTKRDAVLFACGANAEHGLRRTNADKRRAVVTLLKDEEWGTWSNNEIAKRCSVSDDLVGDVRRSLPENDSDTRTYTTKHGTKAKMKTGRIGKGKKKAKPTSKPTPSSPPAPDVPTDAVGVPLPDRKELRETFANVARFDRAMELLKQVKVELNYLAGDQSPDGRPAQPGGEELAANRQEVHRDHKNLYAAFRDCRPHAVCCYCKGKGCRGSFGCRGTGWLTATQNDQAPKDLKSAMKPGKGEAA